MSYRNSIFNFKLLFLFLISANIFADSGTPFCEYLVYEKSAVNHKLGYSALQKIDLYGESKLDRTKDAVGFPIDIVKPSIRVVLEYTRAAENIKGDCKKCLNNFPYHHFIHRRFTNLYKSIYEFDPLDPVILKIGRDFEKIEKVIKKENINDLVFDVVINSDSPDGLFFCSEDLKDPAYKAVSVIEKTKELTSQVVNDSAVKAVPAHQFPASIGADRKMNVNGPSKADRAQ